MSKEESESYLESAQKRIEELQKQVKELEEANAVFLSIKEMHLSGKLAQIDFSQDPSISETMAKCFAGILLSAPNYAEMTLKALQIKDADGNNQLITVTVQKVNGKTPHQLRVIAEERVRELEKELDTIRLKQAEEYLEH